MGLLDDDRIYDILEAQRESPKPKKVRARKAPIKKIAQKEEPKPAENPKPFSLLDDDKIYGILENQRAAYNPNRPKPIKVNYTTDFAKGISGQKDKAGFWRKAFEKVAKKIRGDMAGNNTVKVDKPQSMRFSFKGTKAKPGFKNIMGKDLADYDASANGWGVKTKSIDSTCIQSYSYNPDTQDMQIKFQKGRKIYSYPNVPKAIADDFGGASSKGMYFHQNIKPYSIKTYRTPKELLQRNGWQK
jgi:hypothetical protein